MLLSKDKCQLLIVDVQDKLLDAIAGKDRVVDRCVILVLAARNLGIPITMSEQYPQGLGPTHDSIRDAFANDGFVADKTEFSCVRNVRLRDHLHELRRQGRSQVVIGGIEAHVCVNQTAMDLEAQGFEAFVVADAAPDVIESIERIHRRRYDLGIYWPDDEWDEALNEGVT